MLALGIAGYILTQQRFRFPLIQDKPQVIQVELEDAQAVTPGQGQTVRVAGVKIGSIGDVEVEDGVAVVDMEIDKEYEGLIREDATALLRPKTALKDMFLEVEPGQGSKLGEGDRIPVANTAPDIDPDEVFSALDGDTRDYLKLLISSGGKASTGAARTCARPSSGSNRCTATSTGSTPRWPCAARASSSWCTTTARSWTSLAARTRS